MKILVLNCGSSSIKYQVMDMGAANPNAGAVNQNAQPTAEPASPHLLGKGIVDRVGQSESEVVLKVEGRDNFVRELPIPDHKTGIALLIETITDPQHGVIGSLDEIGAVGHRVAHGGSYFADSALVTPDVVEKIRACFELAPLHNPANLQGILSIDELLPGRPQVAVFDTAFHQTIPVENHTYALPHEIYERYGVRKFGFHGTSHRFVAEKGARMAGLDLGNSRIITCHIGNGGSITAVLNGRSVDTSMGFTPVDGLVMGTRTGAIDPGALLFIGEREGLSYKELGDLINKRSGVLGVSGLSSDMRDIVAAAEAGNERAVLALAMYDARVKHFIGAYAALMGGVEMIIFTGGVGENQWQSRARICSGLEYMGVDFDTAANDGLRGRDTIISRPGSRVTVAVVTTDEELVIAQDTYRIVRR
ncbi:MAG: acetate kinase [Alistipes sp.]|jgi:acetate kinase|nr:acetate kinase [Alistipes sp.]